MQKYIIKSSTIDKATIRDEKSGVRTFKVECPHCSKTVRTHLISFSGLAKCKLCEGNIRVI